MDRLKQCIEESGFEAIGSFDPKGLVTRKEVRDMCEANTCGRYGKSWVCPPVIPTIEEFQEQLTGYRQGYVYQTVAQMEDDFDYDAIAAAQQLFNERYDKLLASTEDFASELKFLPVSCCKACKTCTYPAHPCVSPNRAFPSLEACGLVVSEVCELAEVPYYHGRHTVAFIGGVLSR